MTSSALRHLRARAAAERPKALPVPRPWEEKIVGNVRPVSALEIVRELELYPEWREHLASWLDADRTIYLRVFEDMRHAGISDDEAERAAFVYVATKVRNGNVYG